MGSAGGIVLCGGRSSRMGRPKAWLPFGDELLLQRVVRILGVVVAPIVVVAAPGQDVPPLPAGVPLVRDDVEGRGPLQGLAAGLGALVGQVEVAYLSACDVPFLQPAFVRRVLDSLGDAATAVPHVAEYYHPLAAVYRVDPVLTAACQLLALDQRRTGLLFEVVPARLLEAEVFADVDSSLQSLRNLNTPEDYEAALSDLASDS
jgi:molybdopterin-guanine dinucleotide biosynthesis protein A